MALIGVDSCVDSAAHAFAAYEPSRTHACPAASTGGKQGTAPDDRSDLDDQFDRNWLSNDDDDEDDDDDDDDDDDEDEDAEKSWRRGCEAEAAADRAADVGDAVQAVWRAGDEEEEKAVIREVLVCLSQVDAAPAPAPAANCTCSCMLLHMHLHLHLPPFRAYDCLPACLHHYGLYVLFVSS